jgi:hypothetical protein
MGLKIDFEDDSGLVVGYWVVSPEFSYDVSTKSLHAQVRGYKSKAAKTAGKRPVNIMMNPDIPTSVELRGQDAKDAVMTGDPRTALYAVLKALPIFATATDEGVT